MVQYANARSFRCTACGQSMSPGAGVGTKVVRGRLPGLPAASFAATGLGFRPRCAMVLRVAFDTAPIGYFSEGATGPLQNSGVTGEGLPAADRHVDVDWVQLDCMAHSSAHLGRDDRGARTRE